MINEPVENSFFLRAVEAAKTLARQTDKDGQTICPLCQETPAEFPCQLTLWEVPPPRFASTFIFGGVLMAISAALVS